MKDHTQTRRTIIGAGGSALAGLLAGCIGFGPGANGAPEGAEDDTGSPESGSGSGSESESEDPPAVPDLPRVADPPDAVYVPTHREGMVHRPTVTAGDYALSPMLTYPHRFWLVTGEQPTAVEPESGRGVHLMVTLWDRETGRVLPTDAGAELRVLHEGTVVDRRAPWPMISQSMGFHFGDNVPLPEDGTYTVEMALNPITTRRTGGFAGRFEEPVTARFEFEYDEAFRTEVVDGVEYLDEAVWGQRGALEPMEHGQHGSDMDGSDGAGHDGHDEESSQDGHGNGMTGDHDMPYSALAPADAYPGRVLGEPESGDATFVVRYLENSRLAAAAGPSSESTPADGYLLVSPRTPYNRVPLADMALSVEGALEARLEQTLDDAMGLHYGTAADLSAGETVTIVVESPPQVARHAGYETAFLDMPPMELVVPE